MSWRRSTMLLLWSEAADLSRVAWIYGAVWCVVAAGLLVFDRRLWLAGRQTAVGRADERRQPDAVHGLS